MTKQITKSPLEGIIVKSSKDNIKKKSKKKINKKQPSPRSYRLSYSELDTLKDTTESVSEISGIMKIKDTLVLRALIRLSPTISPEALLSEIKKIKIET